MVVLDIENKLVEGLFLNKICLLFIIIVREY